MSVQHALAGGESTAAERPTPTERPTPAPIMRLATAFAGAKALLSAVQLGVFAVLADRSMDGEELRQQVGIHPRGAGDFFDALVAFGMLEREGGRYRNTAETDMFLDPAKPTYIGGFLEMVDTHSYPLWGWLTEALRTGRPQNHRVHGDADLYSTLYEDPDRLREFLRAMSGLSAGTGAVLAQAFPWQHYDTVVDIGCAEGAVPAALVRAHRHLNGVGYDLPPVQPSFESYVAAAGLSERLVFQPGDFFEDDALPSGDVLIMGNILHNWGLDAKRALLAKAHAALPEGGALLVYDAIIDDERRRNAFGLIMSLHMLVETDAGFDYTASDICGWLREAGFREARVEPLVGPTSLAIAVK